MKRITLGALRELCECDRTEIVLRYGDWDTDRPGSDYMAQWTVGKDLYLSNPRPTIIHAMAECIDRFIDDYGKDAEVVCTSHIEYDCKECGGTVRHTNV
jgi:hypothetical protein